MKNHRCESFDKKALFIKLGLDELAADIRVPDATQAYEKYKQRTTHYNRNRFKTAVSAAAVVLLLVSVTPGPAAAFRGFLRTRISQMISETSKLFQRTEADPLEVEVVEFQQREFTTLADLKNETATHGFIPSSLENNQFKSAHITYGKSNSIVKLSMELLSNDTPFYYNCSGIHTTGRVIDVEDFTSEELNIDGFEITVFSDQNFTVLEWTNNVYLFEFYGNKQTEELIETAIKFGIF